METLDNLGISEEKKNYIKDQLNPVLEEMVAECIHHMPQDPASFMLDWLDKHKATWDNELLSPQEIERLEEENKSLQKELDKVTPQMQEVAKLAAEAGGEEEEEEEEDDDEDDEPPEGWMKEPKSCARASISAEAYGEWNAKKAFMPPMIPKTEEQKDRLKNCLIKSFLFSNLDSNDLSIAIGAMKEVVVEAGNRVINQGDSGDFLFVIESGILDCIKDGKVVKTCQVGDVFGELALLYSCPRAASVDAKEESVLWQLDRDTFNAIVKEAAQKKRTRHDAFLSKVPLLAEMDAYERSQLADALKTEIFSDGQTVVKQGEVGHMFFILEEGSAVATKAGVEVMTYGTGDYFGELALIREQPRAATVTVKHSAKLLSLDSGSFKRLLNVGDLLERSAKYT